MARTRHRIAIPVIGSLAFAAILLVGANATLGVRTGGPLASTSKIEVAARVQIGEDRTWAMPVSHRTEEEIRIDKVNPVGVKDIQVLGVSVTWNGSVVNGAYGYPPLGFEGEIAQPEGAVVPNLSHGPFYVMLGVRLNEGVEIGTIEGIYVRYHVGWRAYETVLPWSLRLLTPEAYERERLS